MMPTLLQRAILCLLLSSPAGAGFAATYQIASDDELDDLTLNPGDTIVWTNGVYLDQRIDFIALGTTEAPITLKAETPGGVVLAGDSQLNLAGSDLVVEGFYFDRGVGTSGVVEFRDGGGQTLDRFAQRCILRDCAFNDLTSEGDNKSRWIVLYGRDNVIERCSFLNKDSTGACILVELEYQGDTTAGHIIRNNHFRAFSRKDGRTNAGDSEAIRIGVSSAQTVDASVLVEGNYFVETDGENEIITNKSRNNRYLANTFRRSRGGLVLRHGSGAWVEGNFFLGEGASDTGGVRITDQDHVIINNYFEGLRGTLWNAGLCWVGGDAASGGTSNGYQYVDNVLVAFNTFYDVSRPIEMNNQRGSRAPTNSAYANNLVYSERGELIVGEESLSLAGVAFSGNLMGGSAIGFTSLGITEGNPQMALSDGIQRPSANGPAVNAAGGDFSAVTRDIDGQTRPLSGRDIGADEITGATGNSTRRPWTDADVGLVVGASFLNADAVCAHCPDPGNTGGNNNGGGNNGGNNGGDPGESPDGGTTPSGAGLIPVATVYVAAGDAAQTNYGSADKLEVKSEGVYSKETYLQFDLSNFNGAIASARLRLRVRSTAPIDHTVYRVEDDTWTDATLIWDAKPSRGALLDTQPVPKEDHWIEFDVTSAVQAEKSGDGILSFAIVSTESNTVVYHSSRASDRTSHPELLLAEAVSWAGFPVVLQSGDNWFVPTGEFLGDIWALGNWIYPTRSQSWIYLPVEHVTPAGAWGYFPRD